LADTTAILTMPVPAGAAFNLSDLRLQRFDAAGNLVGPSATVSVGAETDIVSAWDGQALWLLWRTPQGQIVLRPYNVDGVPAAPSQIIDSQPQNQIGSHRMVAANGRVLITWARSDQLVAQYRYAVVQGVNSTADVRTLGTGALPNGYVENGRVLTPVLSSDIAALHWKGPIFSFAGPLPDALSRGVTLDSSWNPRRSAPGNLDAELLPSDWTGTDEPVLLSALGDRLVVASFVTQRQVPELRLPSDFVLGSFLQPGLLPFASADPSATTLSNQSGNLPSFDSFGRPRFLLQWQDRALVIGGNASNQTMISLFWLR
jgi:hypothetical protein